jgi:ribosomal protein S18 acetylase RimI-like enzyme
MSKLDYNPNLNIFMMCESLNCAALRDLPDGYSLRNPQKNELDFWKRMPFDGKEIAENLRYMDEYFNRVYAPKGNLFFKTCLFAVNAKDEPVGTCFAWKVYGEFATLHWFKVLPQYEGNGIGRALLSAVMARLSQENYPVYLHTQVGSFSAIKLYSDFGFMILQDEAIGRLRRNDITECLPILKQLMPHDAFNGLKFGNARADFLESVTASDTSDF